MKNYMIVRQKVRDLAQFQRAFMSLTFGHDHRRPSASAGATWARCNRKLIRWFRIRRLWAGREELVPFASRGSGGLTVASIRYIVEDIESPPYRNRREFGADKHNPGWETRLQTWWNRAQRLDQTVSSALSGLRTWTPR